MNIEQPLKRSTSPYMYVCLPQCPNSKVEIYPHANGLYIQLQKAMIQTSIAPDHPEGMLAVRPLAAVDLIATESHNMPCHLFLFCS